MAMRTSSAPYLRRDSGGEQKTALNNRSSIHRPAPFGVSHPCRLLPPTSGLVYHHSIPRWL